MQFQRVWNPKAPALCHECGKALRCVCPITHTYCSDACKLAGMRAVCSRCTRALNDPVHPYCTVCKLGSAPRPAPKRPAPVANPKNAGERLDKHLAEQRAMLDMAQRVWFSDQRRDPNHEPAWKSRRRS